MAHYRRLTRTQRVLLRNLVKQARLDAGLTQIAAGNRLGQDQTFVSKTENGKRLIEFVELEQFAAMYGKPITFFSTLDKVRDRRGSMHLTAKPLTVSAESRMMRVGNMLKSYTPLIEC